MKRSILFLGILPFFRDHRYSSRHNMFYFAITLFFLNNLSEHLSSTSCLTPQGIPICCRGKQAACSGYIPMNDWNATVLPRYQSMTNSLRNKISNLNNCYCDEHCTITGDCCEDYRKICHKPIIHCQVGSWGEWGACDRACGRGTRIRKRRIAKPSMNGGRHCPVLKETATCEGYQCGSRRVGRSRSGMAQFLHRSQAEVAHLLPNRGDALQMIRRWNMRWDVRRKLYLGRLIKKNQTEQPEPEPYCAYYKITHRSHGCIYMNPQSTSNDPNWNWAEESFPHPYFQDDFGTRSNGKTPTLYNYNQWIPELGSLQTNNWNYDKFTRDRLWDFTAGQLNEGQLICVTCYPGYMREDMGMRCSGTGLMNVETRWRALRTTDCYGKFRMITMPQRSCTCGTGNNAFVFV